MAQYRTGGKFLCDLSAKQNGVLYTARCISEDRSASVSAATNSAAAQQQEKGDTTGVERPRTRSKSWIAGLMPKINQGTDNSWISYFFPKPQSHAPAATVEKNETTGQATADVAKAPPSSASHSVETDTPKLLQFVTERQQEQQPTSKSDEPHKDDHSAVKDFAADFATLADAAKTDFATSAVKTDNKAGDTSRVTYEEFRITLTHKTSGEVAQPRQFPRPTLRDKSLTHEFSGFKSYSSQRHLRDKYPRDTKQDPTNRTYSYAALDGNGNHAATGGTLNYENMKQMAAMYVKTARNMKRPPTRGSSHDMKKRSTSPTRLQTSAACQHRSYSNRSLSEGGYRQRSSGQEEANRKALMAKEEFDELVLAARMPLKPILSVKEVTPRAPKFEEYCSPIREYFSAEPIKQHAPLVVKPKVNSSKLEMIKRHSLVQEVKQSKNFLLKDFSKPLINANNQPPLKVSNTTGAAKVIIKPQPKVQPQEPLKRPPFLPKSPNKTNAYPQHIKRSFSDAPIALDSKADLNKQRMKSSINLSFPDNKGLQSHKKNIDVGTHNVRANISKRFEFRPARTEENDKTTLPKPLADPLHPRQSGQWVQSSQTAKKTVSLTNNSNNNYSQFLSSVVAPYKTENKNTLTLRPNEISTKPTGRISFVGRKKDGTYLSKLDIVNTKTDVKTNPISCVQGSYYNGAHFAPITPLTHSVSAKINRQYSNIARTDGTKVPQTSDNKNKDRNALGVGSLEDAQTGVQQAKTQNSTAATAKSGVKPEKRTYGKTATTFGAADLQTAMQSGESSSTRVPVSYINYLSGKLRNDILKPGDRLAPGKNKAITSGKAHTNPAPLSWRKEKGAWCFNMQREDPRGTKKTIRRSASDADVYGNPADLSTVESRLKHTKSLEDLPAKLKFYEKKFEPPAMMESETKDFPISALRDAAANEAKATSTEASSVKLAEEAISKVKLAGKRDTVETRFRKVRSLDNNVDNTVDTNLGIKKETVSTKPSVPASKPLGSRFQMETRNLGSTKPNGKQYADAVEKVQAPFSKPTRAHSLPINYGTIDPKLCGWLPWSKDKKDPTKKDNEGKCPTKKEESDPKKGPCKKEKVAPCKKKDSPKKEDVDKSKAPCKKEEVAPCKKKDSTKKEDADESQAPCKKKEEVAPCKKKDSPKKEDADESKAPCKKKEEVAPCNKKESPQGIVPADKSSPVNSDEHKPPLDVYDPEKKVDRSAEDPCKKKENEPQQQDETASNKTEKGTPSKRRKEQCKKNKPRKNVGSCKKGDPCNKTKQRNKKEPCKKKGPRKDNSSSCKKPNPEKVAPCKKDDQPKSEKPLKQIEPEKKDDTKTKQEPCQKQDPCMKREEQKDDTSINKERSKKEDPCMKREDPTTAEGPAKTDSPCKNQDISKKDESPKKDNPCKKSDSTQKEEPQNTDSPCKKMDSTGKKEEPPIKSASCAKNESSKKEELVASGEPLKKDDSPCKTNAASKTEEPAKNDSPCENKDSPKKEEGDASKPKRHPSGRPLDYNPCKSITPSTKDDKGTKEPCKQKEEDTAGNEPCWKDNPCNKKNRETKAEPSVQAKSNKADNKCASADVSTTGVSCPSTTSKLNASASEPGDAVARVIATGEAVVGGILVTGTLNFETNYPTYDQSEYVSSETIVQDAIALNSVNFERGDTNENDASFPGQVDTVSFSGTASNSATDSTGTHYVGYLSSSIESDATSTLLKTTQYVCVGNFDRPEETDRREVTTEPGVENTAYSDFGNYREDSTYIPQSEEISISVGNVKQDGENVVDLFNSFESSSNGQTTIPSIKKTVSESVNNLEQPEASFSEKITDGKYDIDLNHYLETPDNRLIQSDFKIPKEKKEKKTEDSYDERPVNLPEKPKPKVVDTKPVNFDPVRCLSVDALPDAKIKTNINPGSLNYLNYDFEYIPGPVERESLIENIMSKREFNLSEYLQSSVHTTSNVFNAKTAESTINETDGKAQIDAACDQKKPQSLLDSARTYANAVNVQEYVGNISNQLMTESTEETPKLEFEHTISQQSENLSNETDPESTVSDSIKPEYLEDLASEGNTVYGAYPSSDASHQASTQEDVATKSTEMVISFGDGDVSSAARNTEDVVEDVEEAVSRSDTEAVDCAPEETLHENNAEGEENVAAGENVLEENTANLSEPEYEHIYCNSAYDNPPTPLDTYTGEYTLYATDPATNQLKEIDTTSHEDEVQYIEPTFLQRQFLTVLSYFKGAGSGDKHSVTLHINKHAAPDVEEASRDVPRRGDFDSFTSSTAAAGESQEQDRPVSTKEAVGGDEQSSDAEATSASERGTTGMSATARALKTASNTVLSSVMREPPSSHKQPYVSKQSHTSAKQ